MIDKIKIEIKEKLDSYFKEAYGLDTNLVVEEPKNAAMGDLAVPVFTLIKPLGKAVPEVANIVKEFNREEEPLRKLVCAYVEKDKIIIE